MKRIGLEDALKTISDGRKWTRVETEWQTGETISAQKVGVPVFGHRNENMMITHCGEDSYYTPPDLAFADGGTIVFKRKRHVNSVPMVLRQTWTVVS